MAPGQRLGVVARGGGGGNLRCINTTIHHL